MPSPDTPGDVYLFATCVIDLVSPDAGEDAVEVLERLGVRVHFPQDQTCCGQPAYTTGYPEEARRVAAAQLDLFPEPWPIVVPSGSCGGMMVHHWPRLFAGDPVRGPKADAIAARVVEFMAFVAPRLDPGLLAEAPPTRVCLHTSCTARREMGAHRTGSELLRSLPGVELAVHDHEPECCGFGGTFSVKHPEISAAMAQDKTDALLATGSDGFVSGDCGCLLNLNGTLEKRGAPLRGRHVASFLRERMDAAGGTRA
ncbi:(Fe-S)-binding protein [Coralloluteibacterium stylophorae]|uniref:(Fe-S)-binding protein n=1 Tax=Coralloluteibacterium stylophorae TaxID=1776034 RepID=A0A8J8AZ50_9GAMM|nr:(Fe-S)-binding protein [Coralloluteibacterium stylophorae]MBS7458881.1 (Fe-S)-binding protein [Coralloluteibacterium stylophorae]